MDSYTESNGDVEVTDEVRAAINGIRSELQINDALVAQLRVLRQGCESGLALPIIAAFSAPIWQLADLRGPVVSLVGEAASGKTEAAKLCASVWGDPGEYQAAPGTGWKPVFFDDEAEAYRFLNGGAERIRKGNLPGRRQRNICFLCSEHAASDQAGIVFDMGRVHGALPAIDGQGGGDAFARFVELASGSIKEAVSFRVSVLSRMTGCTQPELAGAGMGNIAVLAATEACLRKAFAGELLSPDLGSSITTDFFRRLSSVAPSPCEARRFLQGTDGVAPEALKKDARH